MFHPPQAWCASLKSFCQTSVPSSESTPYKVFASAQRARSLKPRPVIRPGKRMGSLKDDAFADPLPSLSFHRNLKSLPTVSGVISVSAFCQLLCAASASGAVQNPRGAPCARATPGTNIAPAKPRVRGMARNLRINKIFLTELSLQAKAVNGPVEGTKDHPAPSDGNAGLMQKRSHLLSTGVELLAGHGIERVGLGGNGILDPCFVAEQSALHIVSLGSELTRREYKDDAIGDYRRLG